ncbi:MAG: hypothetical protein AAGB32_05010 [Pseudomonadota bacterium]
MRYFTALFTGIILAFFAGNYTYAQNFENNIEQRIEDGVITAEDLLEAEEIYGGDEELIILVKPKLYKAYISPSLTYTDNAFLNGGKDDDLIGTLKTGLEFKTVIANRFDAFANFSADVTEYAENETLNYSTLQSNFGISYTHKNLIMTLGYTSGIVYEDFISDEIISFHRGITSFVRPYRIANNWLFAPYIKGQIRYTNPSEFSYYQGDIGSNLYYRVQQGLNLRFGVRGSYKNYFDYFESFTTQEREDNSISVSSGFDWKLRDGISFKGDIAFTHNNSTLNANDYDAFTATPSLKLSIRF